MTISRWVYLWVVWDVSVSIYASLLSCLIQDLDTFETTFREMVWHAVQSVLIAPLADMFEACNMLFSLCKPAKGFYVVRKI